jgi:hypothetical protein
MKLNFIIKAVVFLICLIVQFYVLENFEKFYYRFADMNMISLEKLVGKSLINIFKPASYRYPVPKDKITENQGQKYEDIDKVDEFGFRIWNIDYNIKKGKRFLFVGSYSIGYGYGVTVDSAFPVVFYKELRKLRPSTPFEVINANNEGLTLSMTFNEIKDVLFTKFRPDIVIIGSWTPLFGYPRNEGQSLEERVFGNKRRNTHSVRVKRGNMYISNRMEHSELWYYLYVKSLLMGKLLAYLDMKMFGTVCYFTKCENEAIDFTGYLYDLHKLLSQHNIPLLVVELVEKKSVEELSINIVKDYVREACDELKIPLLSIPKLRPIWSYTWIDAVHYSAKSNQLIGSDIAKWVDEVLDDNFQLVKPPIKNNINIKTSLILHRSMKSENTDYIGQERSPYQRGEHGASH